MEVEGLGKALKNLDKYSKKVQKDVTFELESSANKIRNQAVRNVPKDDNRLGSSITITRPDKFNREIGTNVFYAPYVEFGTGAFASAYLSSKSAEMRTYARQFYVNGKGRLPARPYLFPAFETERPKLLKRLTKVLKDGS